MSTFTKEQLIARINQVTAINKYRIGRDPAADGLAMDNELFAIALASLEAEAVAYIIKDKTDRKEGNRGELSFRSVEQYYEEDINEHELTATPLYAAPPAPVSVPDEMTMQKALSAIDQLSWQECTRDAYMLGWNACRTAMLQGAEPVTTAYKLPDDFDFDRFNDVVWLEAVASNPHMHSLTTSTIAMVALELNRKLADRNSTVIQDGWVACSERMPGEVLAALQNVARLRRNLNDFCGDKSLIAKCLSEAEGALLNAVNRHSTMLAEPLKEAKNV